MLGKSRDQLALFVVIICLIVALAVTAIRGQLEARPAPVVVDKTAAITSRINGLEEDNALLRDELTAVRQEIQALRDREAAERATDRARMRKIERKQAKPVVAVYQ